MVPCYHPVSEQVRKMFDCVDEEHKISVDPREQYVVIGTERMYFSSTYLKYTLGREDLLRKFRLDLGWIQRRNDIKGNIHMTLLCLGRSAQRIHCVDLLAFILIGR